MNISLCSSSLVACQGLADIVIVIDDSASAQRTVDGIAVLAPGEIAITSYYIRNSRLDSSNVNIALVAHSSSARILSQFSTKQVISMLR